MSNTFKKVAAIGVSIATTTWLSGAVLVASAQTPSIQDLLNQIAALQAQILALQGSGSQGVISANFTQDLTLGSTGNEVKSLQQLLNSKGFTVASSGAGSPGNESTYFGSLTQAALAKYQASVGITPSVGYFGPKSRAYVNSLAAGTGGTGGGIIIPSTGGLSVSMASDNPVSQTVPVGTSEIVPVLRLNFTAGGNVTVTGLNVVRSGLSSDSDLSNVYLMDGDTVLATNLGTNNGVINFSNSAGLFSINANTTKKVTVAVSLATAAAQHTMNFSVTSASAVISNATAVSGSFPVTGNTMTAASVTNLGGVQLTNASAAQTSPGLSINAGQTNALIGQINVVAQNQAMQIKSIKLTNTGSISTSDVSNIKLYNGSTLVQTIAGLGSDNTVTFNLSANPLQLASGQTAILYVYADVNSGVNRNFQLSIQRSYDVIAYDMMYGVGVLPSLASGSYPVKTSYVSIQVGLLTVNRSATAPTGYIVPGSTNFTIAKLDFKAAGEAVRITSLNVALTAATTTGITNLKVIDDQGQQIGTTQSTLTSATVAYTSLNYVIQANTTRTVSIIVDTASTVTGTIAGAINTVVGEGYTSLAAVTSGGASGNTLSTSATALAGYLNSALGSVSVVAGKADTKVASFSLVAGAASGVKVSNITLTSNAAASTTLSFQNLRVMSGSTQIGQTQSVIAAGTDYNFTASTPLSISTGGQLILDVYADVRTGAVFTASSVVSMKASGVTATVDATSQAVSSVPSGTIAGQLLSVVNAGTITYAAYNMPVGAQIGMGTTAVKLATYQFTGSANESVVLTNVYLRATSTTGVAFTNVRLMSGSTSYGQPLNLAGTAPSFTLTWAGLSVPVSANGQLTLDVVADASTFAVVQPTGAHTASANSTTTVVLYQADYQGVDSSQTNSATSTTGGSTFNLLRTTMGASTASGITYGGSYSRYLIGALTFGAGSGNDATLASTTVSLLISNASTTATTSLVTFYDVTGARDIASSTVLINNTSTNFGLATTLSIPASQNRVVYVYADVSSFTTKPLNSSSPITATFNLQEFNWQDGTRLNILHNPTITVPIAGSTQAVTIVN